VALPFFDRKRSILANPRLRDAIARHQARLTPETRAQLHECLLAGPLLVALRELPKQPEAGAQAPAGEMPVEFVTHPGPDGGRILAGFSDPEAVTARAPAAVWFATEPRSILTWLVEEGLGGLLLNPQGPSAFVSGEDLLRMLARVDSRPRQRGALAGSHESENRIRGALERLLDAGVADDGITLEEPRTGRRVQFAGTPDGSLLMVVSRADLASDELERARLMFHELAGLDDDAPSAGEDPEPGDFQAIFSGDAGHAAKAALKVFTCVFGFPAGFDLDVSGP
jgi:hypothetical protein